MKKILCSACIFASTGFFISEATAQFTHSLPLKLESQSQFYSISNNGTAAISWKALNEITTLKTTSNAKTGTATMVLAIDDIPGILKI
ncbi:MAG: hypothetical protein ACRCSQ_05935, partial [Bacteroidales bacterium]